jgi:hypothetical protein
MARSGFYTNRIRFAEMMRVFAREGFESETITVSRFDSMPLKRSSLAAEFRHLAHEDLMVSGFHAILR